MAKNRQYKTKQLISAQRGTLVLIAKITDYDKHYSFQEGIASSNDVRGEWEQLVHEAQLNAVYKHLAYKNKFVRNSEDGSSVDTYVKDIEVTEWYIIYYQGGEFGYEFKRESVNGKLKTQVYRQGKLEASEDYLRGTKDAVHNITNQFIVKRQPKQEVKPNQKVKEVPKLERMQKIKNKEE